MNVVVKNVSFVILRIVLQWLSKKVHCFFFSLEALVFYFEKLPLETRQVALDNMPGNFNDETLSPHLWWGTQLRITVTIF